MMIQYKYGIVSEVKKGFAKVSFEENDIVSDWLPVIVRKSKSDKDSWPLEVNEHVVCIMDCHCNDGFIIGAIYNDDDTPDSGEGGGKWRKKFSDGTVLEYDKKESKLTADVKGSVDVKATQDINIESTTNLKAKGTVKATIEGAEIEATGTVKIKAQAPLIEITGVVNITGAVTIAGALTASSIATSGGGAISASGNMDVTGEINATGDVKSAGKSLQTHTHTAPSGGGVTSPPL